MIQKLYERYVRKKYNKWSKKLYKIFFRKNSTKYVIVRMIDSKKQYQKWYKQKF